MFVLQEQCAIYNIELEIKVEVKRCNRFNHSLPRMGGVLELPLRLFYLANRAVLEIESTVPLKRKQDMTTNYYRKL